MLKLVVSILVVTMVASIMVLEEDKRQLLNCFFFFSSCCPVLCACPKIKIIISFLARLAHAAAFWFLSAYNCGAFSLGTEKDSNLGGCFFCSLFITTYHSFCPLQRGHQLFRWRRNPGMGAEVCLNILLDFLSRWDCSRFFFHYRYGGQPVITG